MIFFTEAAKPVFERWSKLAPKIDSTLIHLANGKQAHMPHNDQCSFAVAIDDTGFSPFVLPLNWNFRPYFYRSFFGPIKIWHDYADVPQSFYELAKNYRHKNAIIQFHAAAP